MNAKDSTAFMNEAKEIHSEILPLRKSTDIEELEKLKTELENTRKELERTKMEAEKHKKLIEVIFRVIPKPVFIYFVDRNGILKYVNEAAEYVFQRPLAEIIGKKPSEIFYADKERTKTLADLGMKTMIEKALAEGGKRYEEVELKYLIKDREIFMLTSGAPVVVDGELQGMVGFFVDITKIKEQEVQARKAEEIARQKEKEVQDNLNYTRECLSRLTAVIKELERGNLNVKVQKIREDEFGKTSDEFNEFIERLKAIVSSLANGLRATSKLIHEAGSAVKQINAGMEQISSAAQQIATGSENLSRLANASTVDLKELQKLMSEVSGKVSESSSFASNASKNAETAREQGVKAISMLKEIVSNIQNTAEIVKTLEVAARNIGKVTERIKSIADQTNLLALNAAIEAARAGEHGRGFAVVADEVRKLAEESRKSTEEINEIVANVQEGTRRVIEAISAVAKNSEVGKEGIASALRMAEEISVSVEKISGMLADIKNSVRESMEKINSIAKGFEEVASTAEENAASSEETSAAIEEQTAAIQQITETIRKLQEFSENTIKVLSENFKISLN